MRFQKSSQNNPFWIGIASFFGGISQDMFLPILPLYFTNVLHFDKAFIGLIDGMVTGSATLCKIVAGYLSDTVHARKSIVLVGYALSWISRPLLVFASSPIGVLALRSLDGIGKGVKDSPKEALVADSAAVAVRGREFGVTRMLDTFGSVVGPFILMGLLYVLQDSAVKYQTIFVLTAIPLAITLFIMQAQVVEVFKPKEKKIVTASALPLEFYLFVGISTIFALGNFSDSFFILRAQQAQLSTFAIAGIYALFNAVYATMSFPFGILSDRWGRITVLLMGWVVFVLIHLGMVWATHTYQVIFLFIAYGLYYAMTYGVARACIADMISREHRGKAYGIYNAFTGLAALPASYIAGLLWDWYGVAAPFLYGASFAFLSLIVLAGFQRKYRFLIQQ